jgi:hypothetical protein
MRVVTPAKLEQLKHAVRAFAVALADRQGRWGGEVTTKGGTGRSRCLPLAVIS